MEASDASDKTRPPIWRRLLRAGFLYLGIPYLAVILIFTTFQRFLIYPGQFGSGEKESTVTTAAEDIHRVTVTTTEGLTLHGWLVAADGSSVDTSEKVLADNRPVVLYFPGNAGDRFDRELDVRDVARLGFHVMIFDYRGYADNKGSPSEEAFIRDAHAIWKKVTIDWNVDPQRIMLFGESLGGAVAIALAADVSGAGQPPAKLVLNSTFSSLRDVVAQEYPYFPFHYLLWDDFNSTERIKHVQCPIIISHGMNDDIVPFDLARKLFAAAPAQSRLGIKSQFVEIAGSGHNDIPAEKLKDLFAE